MGNKYTIFKNYMHNELGITKEDIREWVEVSVKAVAEDHVKHHMNTDSIKTSVIKSTLRESSFMPAVIRAFMEKVKIEVVDN